MSQRRPTPTATRRPTPILALTKSGLRWSVDYWSPAMVLPHIRTRADLAASLEFHANPFLRLHTPDASEARRWHVERVRPSLRWFCRALRVRVPTWLAVASDNYYLSLPPGDHLALFGAGPLVVREFRPWRRR